MLNKLIIVFLCFSWQSSFAQMVNFQAPVKLTGNVAYYEGLADSFVIAMQRNIKGVDIAFTDDFAVSEKVVWPDIDIRFELFVEVSLVDVVDILGNVVDTVFVEKPFLYWTPTDTTIQPDTVYATILVQGSDGSERKSLEYMRKKNGDRDYDAYIDGVKQVGKKIDDAFTDMNQVIGMKHPDKIKRKENNRNKKIKKDKKERDKEKAKRTIYTSPYGDGDGSAMNPMDFQEATLKIADRLILLDGVYTIDSTFVLGFNFIPLVEADVGANPIVKTNGVHPPKIFVGMGVTIKGLWFGSDQKTEISNEWVHVGGNSTIENCTFFNYNEIVGEGEEAGNFYIGNRFINYGKEILNASLHGIYITTQPSGSFVERNIFIKGDGYGVHLWHSPSNVTTRNNIFANVARAHVMQGAGHLTEKNIYWSTPTENGRIIFYPRNSSFTCRNDFFNTGLDADIDPGLSEDAIIDENYYVESAAMHGTNPKAVLKEEVSEMLGKSPFEIDNAVERIEVAFTGTVEQIYSRSISINSDFGILDDVLRSWNEN